MSRAKHTPGPWGFFQDDDYGEEFIVDVPAKRQQHEGSSSPWQYTPVAKVDHPEPETAEANARLIAAAPDLLEALRGIFDDLDWELLHAGDQVPARVQRHKELYEAALAAIAKARGES